ncbi:MAG: family 78 glycoside hydrolase catalytic domain [bacterium]
MPSPAPWSPFCASRPTRSFGSRSWATLTLPSLGLYLLTIMGGLSTLEVGAAEPREEVEVVDPRCEYLVDPLAIDHPRPRLSWRLESSRRDVRQRAYRILVASSPEKLGENQGDLWDSGRQESRETLNIAYAGDSLSCRETCYWKVLVWTNVRGSAPVESPRARWSMGLLADEHWQAKYISYRDDSPVFSDREELYLPAARQYRKEFQTPSKPIRRATIYATALGIYELYLNGRRVSDHWFAPGWTDYNQRAYYRAYDVTDLIEGERQALGAWVADGWYSGYVGFGLLTGIGTERIGRYTYGKTPSLMAQLEIEYEDGTRKVIGTDKTWKVTGEGPIREADMLMGEYYDARRELDGWARPGFDDSKWEQAILASENGQPEATFHEFKNPEEPGGGPRVQGETVSLGFQRPRLEAFPGVPARVTEEIEPVEVNEPQPGKYLYNLGQNFAGSVRLQVKGSEGTKIKLRYGEMLYPDGRLMTENLREARAIDHYVLKGATDGETYVPRFTFHGFQYVEVTVEPQTGLDARPQITGLVLHSDTPLTSTFECSDPMVNQLFQNIVWTQRANFLDLPTDCPQRDERMGWTGDAQVYVGTATYNADVAAFYTKWLRELMASQRPSGAFPGYAPFPFQHGWDFGTAWADAGVICPWTIWQAYDDTRIIKQCWQPMTRFMEWRQKTSEDYLGVAHGNNWGDWLAQGAATPLDYIDTIYFAISSNMMSQMAKAIGRSGDAEHYRSLFEKIRAAFNEKYVNDDGSLTVHTQTAYTLALFAHLIPDQLRRAAGDRLAGMIEKNGTRMATGFLGTRPLLPVLSSVGHHDLAVFLLQSREFPSWGYEVEQGATTIWERWDSYTKEDGFGRHNAAMNSFAHYAFGAVCEWMFNTLAGIRSQGPGYQEIIIRPRPPAPQSNAERDAIHWLRASYQSHRGKIVSNWRVSENDFELEVQVPANATATVVLPATNVSRVTESGHPLAEADGVHKVNAARGAAVIFIGSGHYQFHSPQAIEPAEQAHETSLPLDAALNPEDVNLESATLLAEWNFTKKGDLHDWSSHRHNLDFSRRDEGTFLVGTGDDPQTATKLGKPLSGDLVLSLTARPEKTTKVEFFWAPSGGNYQAGKSSSRQLGAADKLQEYLFRIGDDQPLGRLRFDPLAGQGELQIERIAIYRSRR